MNVWVLVSLVQHNGAIGMVMEIMRLLIYHFAVTLTAISGQSPSFAPPLTPPPPPPMVPPVIPAAPRPPVSPVPPPAIPAAPNSPGSFPDPNQSNPAPKPPAKTSQEAVEREQDNELPILDLSNYNPAIISVCDDMLSADDIYTSLMAIMVNVENRLRKNKCAIDSIGLHESPIKVKSLFGELNTPDLETLRQHPIYGTYIDTLMADTKKLYELANKCYYDHVLMMKIVRMTMKMLINKLTCTELSLRIAKNVLGRPNKFGEPPVVKGPSDPFGSGAGAAPVNPATVESDPNGPGEISYSRWDAPFAKLNPSLGWPWRYRKEGMFKSSPPNTVPPMANQ